MVHVKQITSLLPEPLLVKGSAASVTVSVPTPTLSDQGRKVPAEEMEPGILLSFPATRPPPSP